MPDVQHDPLHDLMRDMPPVDDIVEACASQLWSQLSHNLHAPKGVKVWLHWYELPDSDFKRHFRDIAREIVGIAWGGLDTSGLSPAAALDQLRPKEEAA